jgi:hypothetical protein
MAGKSRGLQSTEISRLIDGYQAAARGRRKSLCQIISFIKFAPLGTRISNVIFIDNSTVCADTIACRPIDYE